MNTQCAPCLITFLQRIGTCNKGSRCKIVNLIVYSNRGLLQFISISFLQYKNHVFLSLYSSLASFHKNTCSTLLCTSSLSVMNLLHFYLVNYSSYPIRQLGLQRQVTSSLSNSVAEPLRRNTSSFTSIEFTIFMSQFFYFFILSQSCVLRLRLETQQPNQLNTITNK